MTDEMARSLKPGETVFVASFRIGPKGVTAYVRELILERINKKGYLEFATSIFSYHPTQCFLTKGAAIEHVRNKAADTKGLIDKAIEDLTWPKSPQKLRTPWQPLKSSD